MNEILVKQLAIDFCTEEGAVTAGKYLHCVYPAAGTQDF